MGATVHQSDSLYRQIAASFRDDIAAGRRAGGERLPTIRALASELGVNRDTVALAYDALAKEGLVEATVGRGTFVRGQPARAELAALDPMLSPTVQRLLDFERGRPRYVAADAVPLHALVPDPSLYPVDEFRRALNRVLSQEGAELLRYGGPQGHAGLREVLAARLRDTGADVTTDTIALTQGATEGIALALRLFAEPGDAVAVEEPTYHNVLGTLIALRLQAVPIPMREGAPDLAVLERALDRPEVKLFYTMPTFHNPLGTATPVEHRRELLALAARAGKPVVEDAYEMDLRYAGKPVPSLAALDRSGLVVQLFSFSKSLFPGARVGSIHARGRLVDALLALKQATDLGGALAFQAALARFVADGGYDRHLTRIRRVLRGRRDVLLAALAALLPDARWTEPEGGHQVWVDLPGALDTRDLLPDAARAGVLFAPGSQFHHDGRASSGLRLSIAAADEAAISRGVASLARVVREHAARGRHAPRAASVHV